MTTETGQVEMRKADEKTSPEGETTPTQAHREQIGTYLRTRREARGLSLDDIAAQTKIRKSYLEAIEDNDYRALPSGPFVNGFITSFARALGVNLD